MMAVVVIAVSPAGLFAEVAAGLAAFGVFALIFRVLSSAELTLLRRSASRLGTRLRLRAMPTQIL
jgi:hypothetical protein